MSLPESASAAVETAQEAAAARGRLLLEIAHRSIEHALAKGCPLVPDLSSLPAALREPGASFVTLRAQGQLRGCIGSLEVQAPLAQNVAENAFKAAFRDPRFEPVRAGEFAHVELHVSVLGPLARIEAASESDLVAQLRPGRDGLVLCEGSRRATYLPSVWEQVPDPLRFVRELKRKAGLAADHWSPRVECYRYGVEEFS